MFYVAIINEKMELELNISRESVRTIVKGDFGLFPYKRGGFT